MYTYKVVNYIKWICIVMEKMLSYSLIFKSLINNIPVNYAPNSVLKDFSTLILVSLLTATIEPMAEYYKFNSIKNCKGQVQDANLLVKDL